MNPNDKKPVALTVRGESPLTNRLTTAAALALANMVSHAQSTNAPAGGTTNAPTKLPEVLVTGQQEVSGVNRVSSPKYTVPLTDIPQTITVVPQEVIQQRGATTLREVLRNVPGISIQAGEGGVPNGDNLSVRGFNARNDTFVDGVRDFGGYSRDPFNLESVEVAKGPSSSTGGRGSTGGSVNLVSKSPKAESFYEGTFGLGTDESKRATIDLNQSLDRGEKGGIPGTAVRLNAMWTEGDVAGRDTVNNSRWAVAPSIAFGLDSPTRVRLSYFHLDQNNLPDYGIPWVPANTSATLAAYSDKAPPVDFSNFYGLKSDYEKTITDIASARLEHDFNERFTLRNNTQYGRNDRDSVVTAPRFVNANTGTAIRREFQSRDQVDTALANQTDLKIDFSTGPIEHTLVPGMEFVRETSVNYARAVQTNGVFITGTALNSPNADLFNPDPNVSRFGPGVRTGAKTDATSHSAAFYVFDTMKFGTREQWELSGGLRWDYFGVDYKSTATNGVVTRLERTDTAFSGRAGLVFKPRENGSIYFGFGTSFNPSAEGLTLANTATAVNSINVAPEQNQTFELGTKWNFFDQRLLLSAAIFRTDKINARTEDPTDPTDVVVLSGQQRVEGVELGVTGKITDEWSVTGGYSYMHSEVLASQNAVEVGRELSNTPKHSLSLWTTYAFPIGLELGGGVQYVGSRLNSTTTPREAPGYWLFDTMVAYQVNKHFTIRLNVYNLANEKYIDRVGGGHFVPGAGRSATLTAEFKF